MALSAFGDKAAPPSPAALTRTLGSTSALWKDALRQISSGIGKTSTAWGFSGKSTGWGLRVKHGERVIVYLTPCEGHFMASFALGGAAVDEVRAAKLPDHIVEALATARRYAEGTGLRFKVSRAADVRALAKIAVIKATFLFLLFAFPGIALAQGTAVWRRAFETRYLSRLALLSPVKAHSTAPDSEAAQPPSPDLRSLCL